MMKVRLFVIIFIFKYVEISLPNQYNSHILRPKPKIEEDKNEVYGVANSEPVEYLNNETEEKDDYQKEIEDALFDVQELLNDFDKNEKVDDTEFEAFKRDIELRNTSIANISSNSDIGGPMFFSNEIFSDIKSLLYLFGIPYIEAPFEAESQCAFLELSGKVDGCITQDSDVFLFGSRHVYKDIFDQNKFVEYYR